MRISRRPSKRYTGAFFYACHLLKNIHGTLHAMNIVTFEGSAKWEHIVTLHAIQEKEGLRASNKLTDKHLNFSNEVMNVALAVQTMSGGISDALLFSEQIQLPGLKDCRGTARFL
jgi:hypothetical protein